MCPVLTGILAAAESLSWRTPSDHTTAEHLFQSELGVHGCGELGAGRQLELRDHPVISCMALTARLPESHSEHLEASASIFASSAPVCA